ncbi:Paraneoplastic antigen Ma1 [Merluccius polli]|uniref:Paraneoplastic antigen Ma1 n=1 Tax=Merluccius polli TaxID=89951 RepID=A0AA47NBH5_MERPO|nr:Paraneoplastic antigen Ma1 [Merluccius polli]
MSDLHRTRKILDSLLPPATDAIKHVSPQALPSVYLQLLDAVYGSVEDGDELLAKFMGTLQNNEEKPSDYLNRLQVALSAVVRRGGIAESERNRCLLKQFCRGCWNDGLIADLQLEWKTNAPPSFAELVFLIRTGEDRQASKHNRMKKHLGLHKPSPAVPKFRAAAQQLAAYSCATPEEEVTDTDILKKQLNEIQAQVAVMQTATPRESTPSSESSSTITCTLKRLLHDSSTQQASERTVQFRANSKQ